MRNYLIGVLSSKNGIQRDGTPYFSQSYIDGQWVRFYEDVPKKMGGVQLTSFGNRTIARSLFSYPNSVSGIDLYVGRDAISATRSIEYIPISLQGVASSPINRTPLTLTPSGNPSIWNFDAGNYIYPTLGDPLTNLIFAQRSVNDISSLEEGPIYVGPLEDNSPLVQVFYTTGQPVLASGGILYCAPCLIAYGNNGTIYWTGTREPNFNPGPTGTWNPNDSLTVANTKIVKVANTRGGGNPTILIWSLDSLNRATLVENPDQSTTAAPLIFINTTIQDKISIMSANSVVEYNQQFFWVGADQFYVYNGIVQSLSNTMNNEWFFQGINLKQRSKLFGVAVPRYKEIWWFYARGDSQENNAAIIYNVELNVWYDNTINANSPSSLYPFTRAAGVSATGNYPFPIFSDNSLLSDPISPLSLTYPIWTHEIGNDLVIRDQSFPIDSYYTTHLMDLWTQDGANTNLLNSYRIAPDFLQEGSMSVTANNWLYPKSTPTAQGPYPFSPDTEFVDFASQGGLCAFTFRSNTVGGSYQSGKSLYFYEKGDVLK